MEQLRTYLDTYRIRQSEFAGEIGVSKGYLSELLGGSKTPSLHLAVKIEVATSGAVPPSAWVPFAEVSA